MRELRLLRQDADSATLVLRLESLPSNQRIYKAIAKVGVIDDRLLIVGSANLNDHSMFNDTEAALVTDDAELATATRQRLWAEHLECSMSEASGDPTDLIDQVWRPRCDDQYKRRRGGRPMTHRISRIDGASRRSARLLGPLQGLLVDG